jgi:Leucine rich repeat
MKKLSVGALVLIAAGCTEAEPASTGKVTAEEQVPSASGTTESPKPALDAVAPEQPTPTLDAGAAEQPPGPPNEDSSVDAGGSLDFPDSSDAGGTSTDAALAPCTDYACDAEVVRFILDTNGYNDVAVDYVAVDTLDESPSGGRIVSLVFSTKEFVEPWLRLSVLPREVGRLSALRRLSILDGTLTSLPDELAKLTNLETLQVYRCPLDGFPEVVLAIPTLKELGLLQVGLKELPAGIRVLSMLGLLQLDGNSLKSLPEEFTQLASLEEVHLSGNQLTALPSDIGNLTKLTRLTAAGNQITELPESILDLGPDSILVRNNQLCQVPVPIANWLDQYAVSGWEAEQFSDSAHEIPCDVSRVNP